MMLILCSVIVKLKIIYNLQEKLINISIERSIIILVMMISI